MSEDKYADKLLGHEYDGIQEYDNPLPGWWTWMSVGTVIFAVIYCVLYWKDEGLRQEAELEAEIAAAYEKWPALAQAAETGGDSGPPVANLDESLYKGNAAAIEAGKQTFLTMCAPCHQADATGNIGPNLTDSEWIHGGTYHDIRTTVTKGVPDKGMVTWAGVLSDEQIAQVAAYVHSLGGATD